MKGELLSMKKKLLTGILTMALSAGMLLLPVSPFYNIDSEIASISKGVEAEDYMSYWPSGLGYGFSFTVSNGEATIIHLDRRGTRPEELSQVNDSIIIPSSVIDEKTGNSYPVTTIGTSAFALQIMASWAKDLQATSSNSFFMEQPLSISIPDSVKIIGENAFDGGNLYDITTVGTTNLIGNKVINIGNNAFRGCGRLTGDLTIPANVEKIGNAPFEGTSFDGTLTLDAGTKGLVIGDSAFQGLRFKKLSFERSGVKTIGKYAFSNMSDASCDGANLLPQTSSLTSIGEGAFSGDVALFAVLNLPQGNNLTYIGPYAFNGCANLMMPGQDLVQGISGNLTIPQKITTIYDGTFTGCERLFGTLNLNNVTAVGAGAFNQCVMLRGDLNLSKVTSLGDSAFSISTVYGNTIGEPVGNLEELAEKERTGYTVSDILIGGFDGKLILSNQLKTIPANCFNGLVSLRGTLNIPSSVTTINAGAFSDCRGFTGNLVIPDSVTAIGDAAFKDMVGINKSLTLSKNLTTISAVTFRNCFNMTGSLNLPSGVTYIGDEAFYGCRSMTGGLNFPSGLTGIGGKAFFWCTGFTGGLTIPNNVVSVGESAFEECAGLDGDLKLSENMSYISRRAFYNLEKIKSNEVIIPNSVTGIGELAFYNCVGIKKIRMERNVVDIHETAFHASTDNKMIYHIYRYNSIPFEHLKETHPSDYESRIEEIPDASDFKVYKLDANGKKVGNPIGENEVIPIPFGKTIQLFAESYYANGKATGFGVLYESENAEMLFADPAGVVSVASPDASGEARIMVKDANGGAAVRYVRFKVVPNDQVVENYTVKDNNGNEAAPVYDLFIGNSMTFTISDIIPATVKAENQNITWSVSDDSAVQLIRNDAYGHSVTLKGLKNALGVVVTMDADYGAGWNSQKSITFNVYQKAKLNSAINVANGVQLTWDFVENANGYAIFRQVVGIDEEAINIANIGNDVNSFVDTSVMNDIRYINKTVKYYIVAGAGAENKSNTISIKYTNKKFNDGPTTYLLNGKTTVSYAGTVDEAEGISIPEQIEVGGKTYKVTAIAANAFKDRTNLVEVIIPKTVKTIGNGAFSGCTRLKKVTMGSGVTTIGDSAFANCKALTSITIPKKVKSIGKNAFAGCKKLKTVTFKGTKVTKIGSKAFKTIKKGATFKIPKKKFSKYKKLIKKSGAPKKPKYKKK